MAPAAMDYTDNEGGTMLRMVLVTQAVYYIVTGVWPLIHMDSFLAVTGPKHDLWLVTAVGALVTVIGIALAVGAARRVPQRETLVLAVGAALALTTIDIVWVVAGRISPIYLADAVAETLIVAVIAVGWIRRGRRA